MTTAGLTNYLQTSLSSCSYILFLKVEKINTHIQALLTSYFSNLTSSLLLHHENASKKNHFSNKNGNIYLYLYAVLFQYSVNWSSEMQAGVINLKIL